MNELEGYLAFEEVRPLELFLDDWSVVLWLLACLEARDLVSEEDACE